MKNKLVKHIFPHLLAIIIFLLVSILFCRPALEGYELNSHDIAGWKGMAQSAFDYKEKHGHLPLWNSNVFSGMPNYMITMEGKSILPDLTNVMGLGLPQPINFFFIACICFYILCLSLRVNNVIGIFGALAFAFATYNPVILSAGHITKMLAIGFSPLVLAGVFLAFEKKYWLGLVVTTLGTHLLASASHFQINYYLLIICFGIGISYLVVWIRNKEWKHIGIVVSVLIIAAIAGVSASALGYATVREYSEATIRGGANIEIRGDSVTMVKRAGLDTGYAFQYSMKKAEPLVLMMPNAFGGSSASSVGEGSNVVKKLVQRGVPEGSAMQAAQNLPAYWGGLESNAGAPYSGVLICFLALLGFVFIKHPVRWGLLTVTALSIMMSWGKFFLGFNAFLFDTLPFYNNFRAPSMALVIAEITLPITAVMAAHQLFFNKERKEYLKANFKKVLYGAGGLIVLLGLIYLAMNYGSPIDPQLIANNWDNSGNDTTGRIIVAGLQEDRQAMFGSQILRTLLFLILLVGLLWLYIKNILKPLVAVIIIGSISLIDLLVIDSKYLGKDKYVPKEEVQSENFTKTAIDEQILADKDIHFRVFNAGPERFSSSDFKTPVYHRTIGGYHPAKLRIYQDIIERYLSAGVSQPVLNMLNVKYILAQDPNSGQQILLPNPEANGPVWLVKNVKIVKNEADELQAIGKINLKDTAIVLEAFASKITAPQWDSSSIIKLTRFDNDTIEYSVEGSRPQFAVFSEVYYPNGWNAYIDGQKVDYVKANYVLRGLSIPAGKHTVKFIFEPAVIKKWAGIAYIGSFIIAVFILGGIFMAWRTSRKKNTLINEKST